MNLSLCITTYNRFKFLRESFEQVINHPCITEIILMDDCSDLAVFKQIEGLKQLSPKIKVFRQAKNRGMGRNKADAISYAQNEWVIIFDSDNVMTPAYIDALPLDLSRHIIYQPEFARPQFDFRILRQNRDHYVGKENIPEKIPMFWTMMNACNYVVNRDEYVRLYQDNTDQKGADTIWMAYLWLKAGNGFLITKDMQYDHRVHAGSGFLADCDHNIKKAEEVKRLILQL